MGIEERIRVGIYEMNLAPSLEAADVHLGETAATIECTVPNSSHAIGDGNRSEASAIAESTLSN